jgi:AP-3 complex subunit delta
VSVAIDGLAHIATPGLAMDLFSDLLPMLNHSKPYVRKKAVLVMYKIFLQYPDALRVAFPRLREKLEDEDICMSFFTSQLKIFSGGLGDSQCNL